MKKLAVLMSTIFLLLAGCGTSAYANAMKEVTLEVENGEFEKALESLDVALKEKPEDKEARILYENIKALNQVKEAIDGTDWEEAVTKAMNLLKEDTLAKGIKEEAEQYINQAESELAENKEKDTDKEEVEAEPVKEKSDKAAGQREKYLKKLNDIKKDLAEFDKALAGTQMEMTQAMGEIFKRWDTALNEIYGALENQLSTSEFESLREEQHKWLTYRDEVAKENSLKFEGGSMASLEYISTQARLTEERCYELVDKYTE